MTRDDRGMILVNVLLIVALAASVVALMLSMQERTIDGSLRMRDATRAAAIARGGELSAVAALRHAASGGASADLAAIAATSQRDVAIEGGSFGLSLSDAQDRLNLATVRVTDPESLALLRRVGAAAAVDPAIVTRIAIEASVQSLGAPSDDATRAAEARLAVLATDLPVATKVNLNTASPRLLAALLGDSPVAGNIAALRARSGLIDQAALSSASITLPAYLTARSDLFWVTAHATVGGTEQRLSSLLLRRYRGGRPQVVVIERWWGETLPLRGPDEAEVSAFR